MRLSKGFENFELDQSNQQMLKNWGIPFKSSVPQKKGKK